MNPWTKFFQTYAAAALNSAPRYMQQQFPEIVWMGAADRNQVALSYDDGPHPEDTPALLEVLARYQVTATFSWLGERIEAYPELVGQAARAGHQLMIHGFRHRSFLLERPAELHAMLDHTRNLLVTYAQRPPSAISYVRPPFGHLSGSLQRSLLEWGYRPVLGSIMPTHWIQPAALTIRQVVAQTERGSLIVLHENLGGPPVARLTDAILRRLADYELEFVSIDALWQELCQARNAAG